MTDPVNVAVVGATGVVGQEMVATLERRGFPVDRLFPLASSRSAGKSVRFRGGDAEVAALDGFDFSRARIALFSAGSGVAKEHGPRAADAGCVVIDNSSCFRYDDDVPLVVPEVNPEAAERRGRGLIANPNCSTIQMVVALNPIHRAARILRINVSTYQSVSGAGKGAIDALESQARGTLAGEGPGAAVPFAFNVVPHIDSFQDNGYTREEMKMVWETRKILGDEEIRVNATAVRVPVFVGHSEAINLETERPVSAEEARGLLAEADGVRVVDERKEGGYPTPAVDAAASDDVFVGRIREDITHPNGLNLWVVGDNLRKGAALNAVQVAELVLESL